jgi:hypothetical protein
MLAYVLEHLRLLTQEMQPACIKFVLTRNGRETRTAIANRNLENWGEIRELLRPYALRKELQISMLISRLRKQTEVESV